MSSNLDKLFQDNPVGIVYTSSWLAEQGFSPEMQRNYRKRNVFESIGHGAMIRKDEEVSIIGGIYALQKQLGLDVHPGGKFALAMNGVSLHVYFKPTVNLYGASGVKLPKWFVERDWDCYLDYHTTSFLPPDVGYRTFDFETIPLRISKRVRSLLEWLYLVPYAADMVDLYQNMDMCRWLNPKEVQGLLEDCKSKKVNRLFLYYAEDQCQPWYKKLDRTKIEVGSGKRTIVEGGTYLPEYQLTVSHELVDNPYL